MKNHCLLTKISCFPFFSLYRLCLGFHSMGPRLFITFSVRLHCFSQVMGTLSFGGGFLKLYWSPFWYSLASTTTLSFSVWLDSNLFSISCFLYLTGPKSKKSTRQIRLHSSSRGRDVTLFENLITPLAKLGLSSFGAFEWFVHTSFLRILQNLPWNHSDQCSVFVEQFYPCCDVSIQVDASVTRPLEP